MVIQILKRLLISKEDRIKAVFLHQKGKSYSEIGNELDMSKSCIKTIIDITIQNRTMIVQDLEDLGFQLTRMSVN